MPRRKLTRELYTQIFEAFAHQIHSEGFNGGPNFTQAAAAAGVSFEFAKKTWTYGWDLAKHPYAAAVKSSSDQVNREARVLAAATRAEKRQQTADERLEIAKQALSGAAKAHAEEGQLVSAVRSSAALLLSHAVKLARAIRPIAERTADALESDTTMKPEEALVIIGHISRHTWRCSQLVDQAMSLERKHLGEPADTIRVQHDHYYRPTLEEAAAVIEELEGPEAVRMVRRRLMIDTNLGAGGEYTALPAPEESTDE